MAAEKNFENKVKKFLKDKGAWVLKYWGGAAYTKSGIPDLLVCFNGWFLGIELKAPNGRPSDLQLYNLRELKRRAVSASCYIQRTMNSSSNLLNTLNWVNYQSTYTVFIHS